MTLTGAGVNLKIKARASLVELDLDIQIEGLRNGLGRILESSNGVKEKNHR
jgi:hypothetical protein